MSTSTDVVTDLGLPTMPHMTTKIILPGHRVLLATALIIRPSAVYSLRVAPEILPQTECYGAAFTRDPATGAGVPGLIILSAMQMLARWPVIVQNDYLTQHTLEEPQRR